MRDVLVALQQDGILGSVVPPTGCFRNRPAKRPPATSLEENLLKVYNDLLIGFAGRMDSAGRWYNASYVSRLLPPLTL